MKTAIILASLMISAPALAARCPDIRNPSCPRDYIEPILGQPQWWIANPFARRMELLTCAHPNLPADRPALRHCRVAAQAEQMALSGGYR